MIFFEASYSDAWREQDQARARSITEGKLLPPFEAHSHTVSPKGAIKVYSKPGQGTTFKILLPASAQKPPAAAPSGPAAEEGRDTATILVIDDEAFVRRTAKAMLERRGYNVVVAENGKQGVDLFRVIGDRSP